MKIRTMFVIGSRDLDADGVSVRVHGKGNLGAKPSTEPSDALDCVRFLRLEQ